MCVKDVSEQQQNEMQNIREKLACWEWEGHSNIV